MSVIGSSILAGASGSAGGDPVYVDDVFSTFLWEGNSTAGRNIVNGVDLAGEGGLVWTKQRDGTRSHYLYDTENSGYALSSDLNSAKVSASNRLTAFNNNGFTLGSDSDVNQTSSDYASWTFRKAPGFFDVVTYTGNESNPRQIAHNLGSVPGMIIVKSLSTSNWYVYHRSLNNGSNPGNYRLRLDTTNAIESGTSTFGATATSTHFTISTNCNYANNYVAYVFAHDDQSFGTSGNESIIKCGSYTGNGSTTGPEIDLGFEPQFVLLRCTLRSGGHGSGWYLLDSMRGIPTGARDNTLQAQESNAEDGLNNNPGNAADIDLTPTGFKIVTDSNSTNQSGASYIYMAIRRPNKPPTAATEVFNPILADTPRTAAQRPEKVDMYWFGKTGGWGENIQVSDRLRGFQSVSSGADDSHTSPWLITNDVNQEATSGGAIAQENNASVGPLVVGVSAGSNFINYIFKRAPGFFDVVAYTGTGSATTINHNLGAVPSVVLVKARSSSYNWYWQHYALGANTFMQLNNQESAAGNGLLFNSTLPTSSVFSVGDMAGNNGSGITYIAYLFGDLPGISKAGTYTGTGSNINVNCGFTNGARFVLIKRTDGPGGTNVGDWYVWDTSRGIASGYDPYLLLNTDAAQVTNTDYIDPNIYGFTVTSSAPAALNTSGGTYLFLAIA